jgi:hypothetical protein
MKKHYFLLISLAFLSVLDLSAQLLIEDFSTTVPPTGWSVDLHATNWVQNGSANANGTAPEAVFKWDPQFNGDSKLISPSINLTGVNNTILTFKHKVDSYSSSGYTLKVATRSNGGAWNTVWSMNPADITETVNITISNTDMNQSDVQFCFWFSGNSYNIDYWFIDDVEFIVSQQKDLKLSSINTEPFLEQGSQTISSDVINIGLDNITSFDITYTVNGTNPITETVNGINLSTTDVYTYDFTTQWNATPGNHNIEVTVSNINGAGGDDDTNNDSKSKSVSVATQTNTNTPLFEVFTSSTCGPCAGFNVPVMTPFMNNNSDIAVIKYQMNWPSPGDPYYTAEGGVRRAYYNVSGVPSLFAGGEQYATSTGGLNSGLTTENSKVGFFDIQANFSVNGNNITINETIMPYISGNYTIHTVVIEKETTQNTGNNGETSFERVMMKMLPDANGVDFNFGANQPYTQSYTYDMSNTNVEEMNDLAVVVFVQYNGTNRIMQSKYVESETASLDDSIFENISIFPNPTNGLLNINSNEKVEIIITNLLGKIVVPTQSFVGNRIVDLSSLSNGIYIVKVKDNQNSGTIKIVLNK